MELRRAGVPPLWCGEHPDTFGGVWVGSFGPVTSVRLRHEAQGWFAELVQFDDPRNYRPISRPPVARRERRPVAAEVAQEIAAAFDSAGFWFAPALKAERPQDVNGFVVEARRNGRYRSLARVAVKDPPLAELLRRLLEVGGTKVPTD